MMGLLITFMLVVCGVLIVLAFYRSGVITDKPIHVQIIASVALLVVVAPILYGVGTVVARYSPRFPTATEFASEVASELFTKFKDSFSLPSAKKEVTPPTPPRGNIPNSPITTPQSPPRGPRLGIGPDAYKDIDDVQVGQWAIEEADKIYNMAEECMNKSIAAMKEKRSGNAERWFFSNEFKKCCAQDVKDLRTEILRRLGPPAKDPKEETTWEMLFPTHSIPGRPDDINPMFVKEYSKYLKMFGHRLKRRANPRAEPTGLNFTEQRIAPEKETFPYRLLIIINPKVEIKKGYIVVKFVGEPIIGGTNLEDVGFVLPNDIMDNEPLEKFLQQNPYPKTFAFQIGKTSIGPSKPMYVEAFHNKPFKVEKVILYDL